MISVIIPLYNKAHTILNTLACVFGQTFQDFEVVIVDDGSTDGGVELIKKTYTDSRLRIVSQSNQGVSAARNTGIANAIGEWISFLDADDLWSEEYLEYVDKAINKFPESKYILGGRKVLNVSDNSSYNFIPANLYGRIEIIKFFQNPHVFAHISASTINKKFIEQNRISFIPGQKFHEDFTFIFQVALLTPVAYIGFPLVTYCGGVVGQATSNLNTDVRLKDGALFRNKVLEAWIEYKKLDKLFPIFMKYETRHFILTYLKSSDYDGLNDFMDRLTGQYKQVLFSKLELALYNSYCPKVISISWIKFTKLLWRMYRFPRIDVK